MGRKRRIWYPGAVYHVMSRGNRRTELFREKADYHRFIECISQAKEVYPFNIYSLCLMTNHFHMIVGTENFELAKIMQKMLHPYTMDFNNKYDYKGHLFESRYTACLIENDRYFLEASRYIHLNPVKAHMVNNPADYEYSTYELFINSANGGTANKTSKKTYNLLRVLTNTDKVLNYFQGDRKDKYKEFVEEKISHEDQEIQIMKDLREDDMWLPC